MRTKLFGAALALSLISTAAFAADLPSRAAPPVYVPPPLPIFTWTGIYIGGQVGYEFGKDSNGFGQSSSTSGVIGGAHIGYNYQFPASNFVVGLEGDVEGSGAKATTAFAAGPNYYHEEIQGSVRGRLGYAVDRALFYATGGAAFGGLHNNYFGAGGTEDSLSHTRVGYTVGGGVEYAIDNNWSVRAEYRYTDFGHYTDILTNTGAGGAVTKHDTDNKVEVGFSYKFDMFNPAPVVARY